MPGWCFGERASGVDELNGETNYEKITALLKRYRAQKR